MHDSPLLAWVVIVPLAGGLVAQLTRRYAAITAVVIALFTATTSLILAWQVATQGSLHHEIGGWVPPLGISLRADAIAGLLVGTTGVVGLSLTSYSLLHFRSTAPAGFYPLWSLVWGSFNGLLLSGDLFNMYVALEVSTLAGVALVAASDDRTALAAGLRYLLFAMVGSLAYLGGVAILYGAESVLDAGLLGDRITPGPTAWAALALLTAGLALKSALFPLHAWLPPAYSSASAPAAVVLAGLVSNGAFYVLLRIWLDVYARIGLPGPARILGVLGGAAIVWGSLAALRQRRLSSLLAFSSVAQIGYFFLFFPLRSPAAAQAIAYLVASHALAKGALFMATGSIRRAVGDDDLARTPGLAKELPLTYFAIAIAGTTLIGMPPTGGFVGKWLLTRAAFDQGAWWWAAMVLAGGLLTAGYVFKVVRVAFMPPRGAQVRRPVSRGAQGVSLGLALMALALGLIPWMTSGVGGAS